MEIHKAPPKAEAIEEVVNAPPVGVKLPSSERMPRLLRLLRTVTLEAPPTLPTPARRRIEPGLTMTGPVPRGVPEVAVTWIVPPGRTFVPPV